MTEPWYKTALCKVHLDMHCPEWDPGILSRIDPPAIVDRVQRAGGDALYFFAKDHYGNAYYNTQIGHKHACLGDRDLVAETLEAGRAAGLRIIAYYSVVWDIRAGREHPEWCQRDAHGASFPDMDDPKAYAKWLTLCHNSGYADYAAAMLDELARNYDLDGFHLDMFHLNFGKIACCCENCRRLFKDLTGHAIPTEASWDKSWRAFLDFRYTSVSKLMVKLVEAVRNVRPGLFVTTNYHGSPDFDWRVGQQPVMHSFPGSMSSGETYTPAFGDMYPGLEARFLRGLEPSRPVELVCWRMNRITDFTTKPLPQFRWEALTSCVNGASVMFIDQPFHDGQLDPVAYDRMSTVFSEINAKRALFEGDPLKHVALYYSSKTRDWYGKEDQRGFQLPVAGAYKALIESHFQVDFLFDENVSAEKLAAFPVVFLPNTAIMSDREADLFRSYVQNGGTLMATFDTSRYDLWGKPRSDFALAGVFGVRYAGTVENKWHFWRALPGPLGADIDPRYAVLNFGDAHRVEATTAEPYGELLSAFGQPAPPDHFFSHNVHPPHEVQGAAAFVNRFGAGQAIYLPHPCDRAYADECELPEHRLLLRNAVRLAGFAPPLSITRAPLNVEAQVLQQDRRFVVHLLAFNPTRQSAAHLGFGNVVRPSIRMDEPATYRARIELAVAFTEVSVEGDAAELRHDGNAIDLFCEGIHHAVIVGLPD